MGGAYKDSFFRSLFCEKREFLRLYNAISGGNYPDDTPVVMNTLDETLFTNKKNDISGLIDNTFVILTDHQSTINANMPFRFLSPVSRLLENSVGDRKLVYRQKLVRLPAPRFYVLYNGPAEYPDKLTLKLSDAYKDTGGPEGISLELIVNVLNINKGRNEGMVKSCETLDGYVEFVNIVRVRQRQLTEEEGGGRRSVLRRSLIYAINYCKKNHILDWFFNNLSGEEENMLLGEWDLEEALEVRREEGWEDGWEKGREDGWEKGREEGWEKGREEGWEKGRQQGAWEIARKAKNEGASLDFIRTITGLSPDEIAKL